MDILLILVVLLLIFLIIRQFAEQAINWRYMVLLPIISAVVCFKDVQWAFSRFALYPLVAAVVVGALVGFVTGIIRGQQSSIRLDGTSGTLFSKPGLISSGIWLGVGIIRIGVVVLTAGNFGQQSILAGILAASGGTLFLVNVCVQRCLILWQASRYRSTGSSSAAYLK